MRRPTPSTNAIGPSRACRVGGDVGVVDVGDEQALVLADEPASTTYLPDRRIFVRWLCANSEADVVHLGELPSSA